MAQIRARKKRVRAETQAAVLAYLAEHPCVDCGEDDVIVLEFDHLRDKTANVSALIAGASGVKRVFEEIAKCEVVCANCHRRRTMRSQNGYRSRRGSSDTDSVGRPGLEPGTTTA